MRSLDRLAGPNPPRLICVDPRETPVAQAATVHLAPLPGTNVALMNGILHEIVRNDWVDHDYVTAHTVGYEELIKQVEPYSPERVAEICHILPDPESAFEAWKQCSAGRPCDYTGISYAKLRGGSGIQWPCTTEHPDGTERLYVDGQFWSSPDYCESYGKDLITGAPLEPTEYRALNPAGKAVIKAAEYLPPRESPTNEFPLYLITGRTLFHFHTRTKTGRAPQL
jgi:anaerobic selenocysteine-containing dehydrogenase